MLNHDRKPHHTFMYIWIFGAIAVLVTGMAGYALQHPRTAVAPIIQTVGTTTPTEPGSPTDTDTTGVFTLRLNETGESHGWSVTPVSVTDSRCPEGVECVWAGEIKVHVRFDKNPGQEIELGELQSTTTSKGKITFLKVAPEKRLQTTKDSDYRFTFLVENL